MAEPAAKPAGPKTSVMLMAAMNDLSDKKGVTIQAIKKYIAEKYGVDQAHLKHRLKKALEKAIENESIVRPKGAEESGASLSGRFKLNKTKLAAEEKAAKKKEKEKEKKKEKEAKPKPKPKVRKDTPMPGSAKKTPKKAAKKSEQLKSTAKVEKSKKSPKKPKAKKLEKVHKKTPVKKVAKRTPEKKDYYRMATRIFKASIEGFHISFQTKKAAKK